MLKFPIEKWNELHELDRVMRVVGTLPCGLMVYVRTDEHAYAPHVHICDVKTRGCRFHASVLLTEWQYFIHPRDEYPYCEGRRDYLRNVKQLLRMFHAKHAGGIETNWEYAARCWNECRYPSFVATLKIPKFNGMCYGAYEWIDMPSETTDWAMSDFDQLLDVLSVMPFYPSENPKSPVGYVERILLRFMEKKMPRAKRARILRHLMIEQRWPAWRDTLNRADRQWEQEQEWDWKLLPNAFCDNEDFRHWCAERNPPPWHDFKMSVRQENKGMMGKMVACAEKNEWTNFLLLADVCGPDTVLRVFCQCVVDRNDEAVAGIVRACGKANIQLPLHELAFKCIRWGPKDAIEILKAIEESAPGMCAALYDRFGRGLLWYSSYLNPKTLGEKFNPFSRKNALAQFLLQCGCDPACENVNSLAWEDLVDA